MDAVSFEDFRRIDLRVATIMEASPHPDAERLLLLKVRIGEASKQVVAGIRKFREPDALVGRRIIVVNNLEPAVIRGERSEGMLLAVLDGQSFALLTPDEEVSDGAKVS